MQSGASRPKRLSLTTFQTCGFEGLPTVGEGPYLDAFPVTCPDQPRPFGVDLCSELLASSYHPDDRDHALGIDIDDVDGLRSLLIENLGQTTKVVTHPSMPAVVARLHRPLGGMPHDLGVQVGQERLDSALIPGTGGPPCKLDVLLRHRSRSISRVTKNRRFPCKAAVWKSHLQAAKGGGR